MDGQHRLEAICLANVGVRTLVVRGVSDAAFATMDTGQRRSLSHVLQMRGETNWNNLAATINLAFVYAAGYELLTRTHATPTFEQAIRFLDDNPEIRESVAYSISMRKLLPLSATGLAFAHFILSRVDQDDAHAFFEQLKSGAALSEDSPILVLRNRLAREYSGSRRDLRTVEQIALTFKAWNAWRRGERIKRLLWKSGGSSPEAFPEPI